MDAKLKALWQAQIGNEIGSSNIYRAVAVCFEADGYENLSKFFQGHAEEEMKHADYLYQFLLVSGNFPTEIPAIPAAKAGFSSCVAAMEAVLAHEQLVTEQINAIAAAAAAANDYAAYSSIQHLVDEQIEELDWSSKLLQNIRRADKTDTLHLFDQVYS